MALKPQYKDFPGAPPIDGALSMHIRADWIEERFSEEIAEVVKLRRDAILKQLTEAIEAGVFDGDEQLGKISQAVGNAAYKREQFLKVKESALVTADIRERLSVGDRVHVSDVHSSVFSHYNHAVVESIEGDRIGVSIKCRRYRGTKTVWYSVGGYYHISQIIQIIGG